MERTRRDCAVGLALGLLALAAAIAPAAADASWDNVVKAAKAEGEVDVHGGPGRVYSEVLTEGFRKAYPEIKLNFSGSSGRDAIPQITRERQAGVYHWDVYVGGTPSILQTLKPAGAFAPLKPALRPELVDDSLWRDGFDDGWMDKERKFTYAFDFTVGPAAVVNWDFVAPADLKTFADLLKPQFTNKIVWDDPRLPGAGPQVGQAIVLNFGQDFLIRLFTEQKIVYTTNRRQNAEWVVRGRYPIGLGTGDDDLEIFQQQGLGQNVKPFDGDITKLVGGPGFGTVSLMDKAPHPAAAKVYIDWLLSKDGQTDWTRSRRNSRRLDVPAGVPAFLPKPGVHYVDTQSEAEMKSREAVQALARKYVARPQKP
jgi:iron(III) transport system substrate-binding protein